LERLINTLDRTSPAIDTGFPRPERTLRALVMVGVVASNEQRQGVLGQARVASGNMTAQRALVASVERWPQETLEHVLSDPRVALSVLNLHLHSHKWVHRRLHQVVFEDDTTVRHSFTVDFTIPEQAPVIYVPSSGRIRLLPLDLLRKQNLVNFEIYDQAGRTLSFFTRAQLNSMTGTMLPKYAEGLLDESLPDPIAKCLCDLVSGDVEAAARAQSEWESNNFVNLQARYIRNRLNNKIEFVSILRRLIENYILLVPLEAPSGGRMKIRYCLDLPLRIQVQDPRNRWQRLVQQFGWRPTSVDFPLEAAAETESYCFEVEDPPGVDLLAAAIVEHPALKGQTSLKPKLHEWQEGGRPSLNLCAHGVQRDSRAVAHVDVRGSLEFWLQAFTFSSFVLALLLAIGWWRMSYITTPEARAAGVNEVAATVLLFFSGIIATLVIKSDPRGLLRKILSRLRQVAMLTATVPVAPVAALLFYSYGPVLRWTWLGAALVALLAGVLTLLSRVLPAKFLKAPESIYLS
jgi:hypothetical protein